MIRLKSRLKAQSTSRPNCITECLKYAHENGCPWDKKACKATVGNGHLECLKCAHENGCPWDKITFYRAAKKGDLECLKYVCSDPKHREPNLQLGPHFIIHSQPTFSISAKSSHIWTSHYVIPVITSYMSFLCFCLPHMSIPPTQPTTFFLYLFSNSCVMIRQLNVCIYVCKIMLNISQ